MNGLPVLHVIGGPNGSGKSTLTRQIARATPSALVLNPDVVGRKIGERLPGPLKQLKGKVLKTAVNWLAVVLVERTVKAAIEMNRSVIVETVMSTDKYRKHIEAARKNGFHIRITFVTLRDPDLNVQRVAQRVNHGGHDVPEEKIRGRYERSHRILQDFALLADQIRVYDNSAADPADPILVASKSNISDELSACRPDLLPDALRDLPSLS